MILDLKRIFVTDNSSLPLDFELDLSELEFSKAYPLKKPIAVRGNVENRAGVVSLKVKCIGEYDADCDRCGEPTVKPFEIEVDRVVVESLSGEDTGEYIIAQGYKLDIDEVATDEVVLGLPVKHLCSKECKGVCSECGKNLNSGPCSCTKDAVDPRLAVLAELLK